MPGSDSEGNLACGAGVRKKREKGEARNERKD
jgi:hypothetical protein